MKKLFFGIIAAIIVSAGIFAFAGCEKEEENTDIHPVLAAIAVEDCPACSGTDLSLDSMVYVQNQYFTENYGIDIREFSSNTNFQQLITEINEMTSDIHEFMANADPAQLEESRQFLEQKQNELQDFENSGNNFGMLSVAEEIFAAVMPNKPLNAYTYGNHTFQLPVDYVEMKTEAISNAIHQLEARFPSLQDMSEEDFRKLLEIGFIASQLDGNEGLCFDKAPTNGSNSKTQTKEDLSAYEKCIQKAKAEFAGAEVVAVGALVVREIKSAGLNTLGPLGTSIYTIKSVQYMAQFGIATYSAYRIYSVQIDNCRLKYKQ